MCKRLLCALFSSLIDVDGPSGDRGGASGNGPSGDGKSGDNGGATGDCACTTGSV